MSKRSILLAGLAVLALAQLAVPVSMIQRRELALKKGQTFRFKTAPVDPYDAFRGRYVALSVENRVPLPEDGDFARNQKIYALVSVDDEGFARFTGVSTERPADENYIRTRVRYVSRHQTNMTLRIPFDRFYMDEFDAPDAERHYREHSRQGKRDAYVNVRVLRGFPVLENVYVADVPLLDFVRGERDGKNEE